MVPISGDEEIASVLAVDDFREDEYLVLLTRVRELSGPGSREGLALFAFASTRACLGVLQAVRRPRPVDLSGVAILSLCVPKVFVDEFSMWFLG